MHEHFILGNDTENSTHSGCQRHCERTPECNSDSTDGYRCPTRTRRNTAKKGKKNQRKYSDENYQQVNGNNPRNR